MTKHVTARWISALVCAGWLTAVSADRGAAQGNQGADNLMQSGPSDAGKPERPSVQVGAKTTSGTTQGFSGPRMPGGQGLEPPALPDASLCRAYEGRAFHADCIAKVTRR